MGTPQIALPALNALLADPAGRFEVCLVLSQPDRPAGRGLTPRASAVTQAARAAGLEVWQPTTLRPPAATALFQRVHSLDLDFAVVIAYGLLLTAELIDAPRLGTLNIHGSLLPRWRGAAPIQRAILAGDRETGVSLQQVRLKVDSGPVFASRATSVGDKNYAQLIQELSELGAGLLVDSLPRIAAGELVAREQPLTSNDYAAKLTAAELALDPLGSVEQNLRRVRAASDQTPARARIAGRDIRVLAARAVPTARSEIVGAVRLREKRLELATTDGWLELESLIPAGKRAMSGTAFAAGLPALQSSDSTVTWEKWR